MLGMKPKIRGNVKGLESSTRAVAAAVHRKPWLTFTMSGQVFVDPKTHEMVDENHENAELETFEIDYHFRVDPKKIKGSHNNKIAALQDRREAAKRTMETVSMAAAVRTGEAQKSRRAQSRDDLPDTEILMECYQELDEAFDERLLACIMRDDMGRTVWDYTDEEDNPINLTPELLKSDLKLAEAMQTAFTNWYNPTKPPSSADSSMTVGNGMTGSEPSLTNGGSPSQNGQTHNPSSSGSPMQSSAGENNGMTPVE